ncbi:hypothetical protein HYPSUDRAFT_198759 [Hypholoma sublateritium FD-334 SS-4]|uniref:Uncharacterized protein n=1 Tax=Hypholoma sublateritium (strain FD-334 SS-4) TaxID=945553 RepID=A0A0D2PCZ8_HYPSF|nr:hypothetical protein HYPSUDRAFT_198759 [Hypholoma sublateritium FD-334 SS-4]
MIPDSASMICTAHIVPQVPLALRRIWRSACVWYSLSSVNSLGAKARATSTRVRGVLHEGLGFSAASSLVPLPASSHHSSTSEAPSPVPLFISSCDYRSSTVAPASHTHSHGSASPMRTALACTGVLHAHGQ